MSFQTELEEAIIACQKAQDTCRLAQKKLKSASNWGWFDILGGGTFSSWIKHSKLSEAKELMMEVQQDLNHLSDELDDVNIRFSTAQLGFDWNQFFDIFVDNIFSDITVQNQISKYQKIVSDLLQKLELLEDRLSRSLEEELTGIKSEQR